MHPKGEYLDKQKYWVILEAAETLGVPIYIHPRAPSPDMVKPYLDYPLLDSAVLGFSHEVSLHALRLIFSGVFDRYPKLNIILGHIGERERSPRSKILGIHGDQLGMGDAVEVQTAGIIPFFHPKLDIPHLFRFYRIQPIKL